jgi:NADH-quinone oxidoreductase subunit L
MFHLFTHAFFKALLFLGAGAVIHAIHSNEMKDMGGLRKSLPVTHITFLLACLAIAGIPPFAGFFSKEAILSSAFEGNRLVFYTAIITSGLTSFYMFRLYFRIFWYKPVMHSEYGHNHEKGQWAMNIPLILLATGSVFAGLIPFGSFVSSDGSGLQLPIHLLFSLTPVLIGVAGFAIAAWLYAKENPAPEKIIASLGVLYRWTYQKFYIDEIYLFITKKIVFNLVGRPIAWFDKTFVDGLMNGTATMSSQVSESIKGMQSGRLQSYAMYFLGGIVLIALILIIKFM